jgi:GxxExxY protein
MTQMSADESDPETYAIIGAAMAVHRELGHGFLEAVYQAALAVELSARHIEFLREAPLPITYRGTLLPVGYRIDFLCFGAVIVELKALAALGTREEAQVTHYLKASGYRRALLLNFGQPRLEYKRIVLTPDHLRSSA